MDFLKTFKTRWDKIPSAEGSYRLLCSNPTCSLSCANLRGGKLSVTSIHGSERHSYELDKNEMAFIVIDFLDHLSEQELQVFAKIYSKASINTTMHFEKLGD